MVSDSDREFGSEGSKTNPDDSATPERVGRRGLMIGAAAAGTGIAAGLVAGAQPAGAVTANGGALLLGKTNTATAVTKVTNKDTTAITGSSTGPSTTNADGIGVHGASKNGYGVRGDSSGFYAGVGGYATAAGSSGVYGEGDGANGYGVYGLTTGSGGTAVYAAGNATVTGSLSKGGGSFKIDHPLDPKGKYLYHSFVESPDMMNVYNGTVVLGRRGKATVELPEWFEALNSDFRYQLTAVGKPAPKLHVSEEISGKAFQIAGGRSGQQVSWQVTGIRRDAWANANRIPVEVEKAPEDKGRFLHPELFGGEPIHEILTPRRHLNPVEMKETA
jgi:hypothetical protein